MMTLDEIKQILEMVREHELAEFELEQEGVKLRIKKEGAMQLVASPVGAPMFGAPPLIAATVPAPATPPAPAAVAANGEDEDSLEFAIVKAPLVGTFYRAPSPDAPIYTDVGEMVRKKQVLCIIEAMKLMNEIESEYEGEVVKIYVENGQPVQYGERLFAIKAR